MQPCSSATSSPLHSWRPWTGWRRRQRSCCHCPRHHSAHPGPGRRIIHHGPQEGAHGSSSRRPVGDRDRDPEGDRRTERRHAAYEQLDHACLDLSIALLDHPLKGDLFESAVVAFLAVLGVDVEKQTFRDPYAFTSSLSGLIKMAQMLVAQRAVQMADHGQVEHPADALEAMRERFLLPGVAAPFNWLTRLRTFGKRIQNTTTSLGYIYWSDDQQTLSYKELHLTMAGLRGFVRTQVELAQLELEGLFLLHEEETREAVVPRLALVELADDPTNNRRGWNFLQDHRTRAALPTTGEQWLMDRVVATDWLRAEWVGVRPHDHQVMWHTTVVDAYTLVRHRSRARSVFSNPHWSVRPVSGPTPSSRPSVDPSISICLSGY
ncbi:uncharacterized protein ACHE_20011A [Aspergillus chevalieri]|uniref:Uncharacterized protein n=1 Tax=Aspergillus chevalieri TaxID=182096 RepID=A0A7R7VGZ1_ASPCH|nr:uncharacterized protein ACHE_20011A [Aspergillus chevalieri]BCR84553.1 hypothetical protein ACHE_20011A [Aspergillus chevalieri]